MPAMMLDPTVIRNAVKEVDGLGTDRTPLPLNLVAQIISYVRCSPLLFPPLPSTPDAVTSSPPR